jgi:glycosyltransferase involved in cell wall biosynthesis
MTGPPCAVCVPARNEEEAVPRLLAALAAQDVAGPLRVVVSANNCTDDTAACLRAMARREPRLVLRVIEATLPPDLAKVGVARGMAMDAGAAWLEADGVRNGVLIATDSDAAPPSGWVAAKLRAIRAGAEAVGGEIRLLEDPAHPLPAWLTMTRARVTRYWSAVRALAHRIDPLPHDPPPRHGDHTGASLAVTVAAYRAAGGVPALASQEDLALVAAIERNGGRLRHAPDAWVAVSAREEGRASGGMAEEMRRWRRIAEGAEPHLLPDAAHWQKVFQRRLALRQGFAGGLGAAAARTGADPALLERIARESANDIAFVTRAEPVLPPLEPRWEPIGPASLALEQLAARDEAA